MRPGQRLEKRPCDALLEVPLVRGRQGRAWDGVDKLLISSPVQPVVVRGRLWSRLLAELARDRRRVRVLRHLSDPPDLPWHWLAPALQSPPVAVADHDRADDRRLGV